MCDLLNVTHFLFALCIQATTYGGLADEPFTTNSFQRGMNVYLSDNDFKSAEDYIWSVQQLLDRLEKANVNAISLTWPIFTEGKRSNKVFVSESTPSLEALTTFSAVAEARGFGVIWHPILDEGAILRSGRNEWRGTIRPRNIDTWFISYGALMHSYAVAAETVGVDAISLGTELVSMEKYADRWRKISASVREVYGGSLTYASNRTISAEFPWDAVDFVGIDAFFKLNLPANASAEEIAAELRKESNELLKQAATYKIPIVFTEVGTTSQRASYRWSALWDHRTKPDQQAQARYYEAVCRVWKEHLNGIYWWTTTLYPKTGLEAADDIGFDPMGKKAEEVIRDVCF